VGVGVGVLMVGVKSKDDSKREWGIGKIDHRQT